MSNSTSQRNAVTSATGPLFITVLAIVGLLAILSFTSKLEEYEVLSFLVPYESAISVVVVAILGHIGVQSGTKWVTPLPRGKRLRTSPELSGS